MKMDYCVNDQVESCQQCSYVSYGRDCQNNPITLTIKAISDCLGTPEAMTRKLLVDAGADIDELAIDPDEFIPREVVINLAADRAADRIGRRLVELLR